MRVFLDTNVFIEYFCKRTQYVFVRQIFEAIEDGELECVISAGSFYTIAYAMEMELKRREIHNPDKLEQNRKYLNAVLDLVKIVSATDTEYRKGVNDLSFRDLEDSFQYRCAISSKCDVLVTINLKDFRGADADMIDVLMPDDFIKLYLS